MLPLFLALVPSLASPVSQVEEAGAAAVPLEASAAVVEPLLGCWRALDDASAFLWLEPGRCALLAGPEPTFHRVRYASADGGVVAALERWARERELALRLDGEHLVTVEDEVERRYARAELVPDLLRVLPYELPEEVVLGPEVVGALRDDLVNRAAEDQRVRSSPTAAEDRERVDAANTAFLVAVVQEVGWIDASRFGREASEAAFLLVQHARDLRLQVTALPHIEADVDAGLVEAQAFALLHDRVRLRLGYPQRYGSQIGTLEDGTSVLMPCEDPEGVDEHRAALGLGPLADYLALFEEDGVPLRRL